MVSKKNFALIGVGGYIAPRHLRAIKETGNDLVVALDKHDSVGILDSFFQDVDFFTEFERFDRHCEKLRIEDSPKKIDFVSVCSPNYLHDAHIRFGLRIGANVICEKPLVLNPWNVDALEKIESESKGKIYTVLQLRYHPTILALKEKYSKDESKRYKIDLSYITPRGNWYFTSWKGSMEKSGGVATNIGIHFFDMLAWIFGDVKDQSVHYSDPKKMAGSISLERADVRWFLSIDRHDLAMTPVGEAANRPFRSITIDGDEVEFSDGFKDLHTVVYENILNGNGYGLKDARPSIRLVHDLRNARAEMPDDLEEVHPLARGLFNGGS